MTKLPAPVEPLSFWVYQLKRDVLVENWNDPIDPGSLTLQQVQVICQVVVDDPSDKLCLYGYGTDGVHYQYDSYEAYYASDYFAKDFDKHGLYVDCFQVEIPAKDLTKFIVDRNI